MTDPWPRLVAEGKAHWEALIARGAVTIEDAPHFAEFTLAAHFGLTPEAMRPVVSEVAATYDMTRRPSLVELPPGYAAGRLTARPQSGREAMLATHRDFVDSVIEGRIPPPGAAIALAEAANAVSHDFFLTLFDRRWS